MVIWEACVFNLLVFMCFGMYAWTRLLISDKGHDEWQGGQPAGVCQCRVNSGLSDRDFSWHLWHSCSLNEQLWAGRLHWYHENCCSHASTIFNNTKPAHTTGLLSMGIVCSITRGMNETSYSQVKLESNYIVFSSKAYKSTIISYLFNSHINCGSSFRFTY